MKNVKKLAKGIKKQPNYQRLNKHDKEKHVIWMNYYMKIDPYTVIFGGECWATLEASFV